MSNYCPKGHWEAGMALPCKQCEIESLRDQLVTRDKQIVMARQRFSEIAWSNDSKWQSDAAMEALAATSDLDELILCEREPVAYTVEIEGESIVGMADPDEIPNPAWEPLYRAKEQGK